MFGLLYEDVRLSVFLDLAMFLHAVLPLTWIEMGKGKGPRTLSPHLQTCHIPPETGFLRSLTCGQLHFVRPMFLTLPRENSRCCRSRPRQTTHPCWNSVGGPVKAQSWRLGRLRSLHSPTQTGILLQESRKWCYCELVMTLCHSEFSVLESIEQGGFWEAINHCFSVN